VDWLIDRPIAHRGLHGEGVPENSLAAFAAAADAGIPIELDVRMSADGHVVVAHDDDLLDTTGFDGRISRSKLAQLARLRLAGTDQTVPRLADVLDVVDGRVGLMIELKNHSRVGPLERVVARLLDGHEDTTCIASFNPFVVSWFAECHPHMTRVQISGTFETIRLPPGLRLALRRMLAAGRGAPHALSYELKGLPDEIVTTWRARGLPIITWTVATDRDLDHAMQHADNYIFDGHVFATRP
jgi:glycerophosphoryl diester phosphodiesterase